MIRERRGYVHVSHNRVCECVGLTDLLHGAGDDALHGAETGALHGEGLAGTRLPVREEAHLLLV